MNDAQILEKLGLTEASQENKDRALIAVNGVVELRSAGIMQDLMSKEQLVEFSNKSKVETPETVMQWLSEEIIDAKELYESVLQEYLLEKQR